MCVGSFPTHVRRNFKVITIEVHAPCRARTIQRTMGIQQKNEKTYRGEIRTKQDRNNTTILLPLPGLPAVFISGFRLSGKVFTFALNKHCSEQKHSCC